MTKKDIVKAVSDEMQCSQALAKQVVQRTLDEFVHALQEDGRLELRNFGVFEVKHRKSRTARNPRTGLQLKTAEHYTVTFKPGKEMTDTVNNAFLKQNAKKKK